MQMPSYSMANNMTSNSCLQQQASQAYSCMLPPGPGRGYEPLTLSGYPRPGCPTAMQSVNGQFGSVNNPTNSTGEK